MSEKPNNAIAVIGIDIGKKSFHVVGLDARGAIVRRQRWSRGHVEARFANMPPCLIGMKACVGAHHLSPKLQGLGHDARVMPANYVWPYSQKNDFEMRRRSPRRCSVCARSPPDALKRPLDTQLLPWPISRTGFKSHSDRVSARFWGGPLGTPAKCQTACATVSAPSSLVSCVCNTFARPHWFLAVCEG